MERRESRGGECRDPIRKRDRWRVQGGSRRDVRMKRRECVIGDGDGSGGEAVERGE